MLVRDLLESGPFTVKTFKKPEKYYGYIYSLVNLKNNKIYIGQSTQEPLLKIKEYYSEVCHSQKKRPICSAIKKYKPKNFEFSILGWYENKETLDKAERNYIQLLHCTNPAKGYNIELGGNTVGKHSPQTKKKISNSQKGKLNHMYGKTGKNNMCSKKVIELISKKKYASASDAARELNLSCSHICAVARGERGSTGGYVFRYLDKNEEPIKPKNQTQIKNPAVFMKAKENYKNAVSQRDKSVFYHQKPIIK